MCCESVLLTGTSGSSPLTCQRCFGSGAVAPVVLPRAAKWPALGRLRVHLIPRRVRRVLSAEHKSPRRSNGMWQCIEQEAAILTTSDPRSFTGPASRGDRCGIVRSKLRERRAALKRSYLLGIMSLEE